MMIGPTGNVRTDTANTYSTGAQNFGAATQVIARKAASPTPTADGDFVFDTVRGLWVAGGGGVTGSFPRLRAADIGTQTFTNSTASDQDFTALYQIPANTIVAKKNFLVTATFEFVTGVSSGLIPRRSITLRGARSKWSVIRMGSASESSRYTASTPSEID